MRVLVLDGNENQAVACVRSLGRAGHEVLVGSSERWSKAGWSRYCSRQFRYVAPQQDATRFVDQVAEVAKERPGTLVLPMTERTTMPISAGRDRLDRCGALYVLPDHATQLRAMDKSAMTTLAASLGIDTPATVLLLDDEQAARCARTIRYPAVLKPRSSEEIVDSRATRSTGKPEYVRSEGELLSGFRGMHQRAEAVLAQEYVEGSGAGYFALMRHGELRAEFSHRRLRDVRPTGSGSALRESTAVDPRVRDAALPILQALKWHGVAMVEFRIRPDGTPVFLEVNGRFWNSLALPVVAGVDFPGLLLRLATDGDVSPVTAYRTGVRCRWWLGDVRHLLAVIQGRPEGFEGQFPGRLDTLRAFFTPVAGTYHDNFTWDDPLPEIGDWVDFLGRRVPAMLRKRAVAA